MSLIFLKLGGSLITNKQTPRTPRREVLARLMDEIAAARQARAELRLVLGHGSGSFGHVEASKYGTRQGVDSPEKWRGFAQVQAAAGDLNRLVCDAARAAGLPVLNLPPSASAVCRDGIIETMAVAPLEAALAHGLVPLVFGDVVVDTVRGGTIASTEDVFRYLAPVLRPERVLLVGIEPGVLAAWPDGEIIPVIADGAALGGVGGAQPGAMGGADVTGGMASKVREMQALVRAMPSVSVRIFSGAEPGRVRAALLGEAQPGTLIR
jgi:isopentenyl phosphate kinase